MYITLKLIKLKNQFERNNFLLKKIDGNRINYRIVRIIVEETGYKRSRI